MSSDLDKLLDELYRPDDSEDYPGRGLTADVAEQIGLEVAKGISVEDSDLTYTEPMLAYRKYFEEWVAKLPPGAEIDFPTIL